MDKTVKYEFDCGEMAVGRLATMISTILIGKNDPAFKPNVDNNNRIVVKNTDKLVFTGKKLEQKEYRHHSCHPGGLKSITAKEIAAKNPKKILLNAVSKMLPKNKFRTERLKRIFFK